MIKLIKRYPLIGMLVGALAIGLVGQGIAHYNDQSQVQLSTLNEMKEQVADQEENKEEQVEQKETTPSKEAVAFETKECAETLLVPTVPPKPTCMPTQVPIYICGAVHEPGVYYVSSDAILDAVVRLAGGLTEEADPAAINLASPVKPNEKIIVPKEGEKIDKLDESYDNIEEPEASVVSDIGTMEASEADEKINKGNTEANININTANKEALMSLPGIGSVKADAIIAYRNEHGAYKNKEDLKLVSGIGEKTYEKLSGLITV